MFFVAAYWILRRPDTTAAPVSGIRTAGMELDWKRMEETAAQEGDLWK